VEGDKAAGIRETLSLFC